MADLLVDTDVFVDHLRGARRMEPGRDRILYSVVRDDGVTAFRRFADRRLTGRRNRNQEFEIFSYFSISLI